MCFRRVINSTKAYHFIYCITITRLCQDDTGYFVNITIYFVNICMIICSSRIFLKIPIILTFLVFLICIL